MKSVIGEIEQILEDIDVHYHKLGFPSLVEIGDVYIDLGESLKHLKNQIAELKDNKEEK